MPNHVFQFAKVSGDAEKVKEFFENHFTVDEQSGTKEFDFETFIPMPEELKDTVAPTPSDTPKEEINRLVELYGAANWYDWAIKNWNTKWNAYDTEIIEGENEFNFMTAWTMPTLIYEEMAKKYPELDFTILAVEEGGFFASEVYIKNGSVKYEDA